MNAQEKLQTLRARHAVWSAATFGNVSAVGPAKHLAKEALEVAAAPHDPIEHADCQMLLWDMQRRAGISDDQLADAIDAKLTINEGRIWPGPKEGEARDHDRSADLADTLGAEAMREAAAGVAESMIFPMQDVYQAASGSPTAGQIVAKAIRALPAPSHADRLAQALKLPEIAELINEAANAERIFLCGSSEAHMRVGERLEAILAQIKGETE